jgi:hypothetical protein
MLGPPLTIRLHEGTERILFLPIYVMCLCCVKTAADDYKHTRACTTEKLDTHGYNFPLCTEYGH